MNKGFDWRDRILWLLWKTLSRPRQSMGLKRLDSRNWWQFKHGYKEEECGVTNWILPISLFLKVRIKCKEGLLNQKELSSTEGSCQQITNCKTEMLAICWRESPLRYISGSISRLRGRLLSANHLPSAQERPTAHMWMNQLAASMV